MALFKRGDVFWAYHWIDGVRHARSTGTGNRKMAETIAQRFKEELNLQRLGIVQPKPEMTFGELAALFLADGSPKPYHYDRLKVLLPYWAETRICRINKAATKAYRAYRHAEKEHLSDTTINRDLEALRRMFSWAVEEGLLLANPLHGMSLSQERRKPRVIMSVEEEDKLLRAAPLHLRSIIKTALDTGMRRGELLAQRWEHVDFSRRLILVTHSKTAGGEGRPIPFTDRVFYDFRFRRKTEGLVFTFNQEPITRIKTAWKATLRRAELRHFRFHDLRHTFNTRLLEAGVMQEIRKALMGHSTGEEVNAIYTHVELPMLRDAITKLEAWTAKQRAELNKAENQKGENTSDGTSDLRLDQAGNPEASEG